MDTYYWIVWLILAGVFLILELATVAMVSLWFVAGSLAAMVAALAGANLVTQVLIMLISSVILLLIFIKLRPKLGILPAQRKATNADRLIGKEALVTMTIDPLENVGQVQAEGQIWSARTEQDSSIEAGKKVRITGLRGVKLVVEEIK